MFLSTFEHVVVFASCLSFDVLANLPDASLSVAPISVCLVGGRGHPVWKNFLVCHTARTGSAQVSGKARVIKLRQASDAHEWFRLSYPTLKNVRRVFE